MKQICQNLKIGGLLLDLEYKYNINVSKNDVYNILVECQCFDIEITIMPKFFCDINLWD
mgnify:FL=1